MDEHWPNQINPIRRARNVDEHVEMLEGVAARHTKLVADLLGLLTQSQQAEIRGKSRTTTTEDALVECLADEINTRHNLQNAVDEAHHELATIVYNLGNA